MKIKKSLKSQSPWLTRLYRKVTAKTWPKGSIVFYTGNRKKALTPNLIKEGVTGTESALLFLTKEWAKLGYPVTVYTSCEGQEGIYEGVEYINHYKFNWEDTFDVLIILAHPYILQKRVKARKLCWEWQDILGEEEVYPPEKIKWFDVVFCKSHYQRQLLNWLPDEKFAIYPNGANKISEEFYHRPKSPYKLIYASRYYRGLDSMLTYGWPIIKREIPEAELHIYHGWCRPENLPDRAEWKKNMIELFKQEGVFEHGRVGQEFLIEEKSTASIHYYGCTYPEIDCISIRESAAVGCVPVTTDFAVFHEKDYCIKVPISGTPESQESQEAVAYRIVELLKNPEELEKYRQGFYQRVKEETWDNIAKLWVKEFDF